VARHGFMGKTTKTKQQENTVTANNILLNKSLMNFEAFLASGFQAFVNKLVWDNGYIHSTLTQKLNG
jgi:hypothetical protein